MTNKTRVSMACVLSAAALLAGVAAPVATAAPAAHHTHPGHSARQIPFTAAEVTAGDDGTYEITWQAPGVRKVAVRANGRTVAVGGATGRVTVRGLPAADRQWFDLVPDRGQRLRLADRLIRLEGTVNFRDAGGYRTEDGQWVRMGAVYRTDSLDKLTDADLAKLKRLGIRVDYDLRTASSAAPRPTACPRASGTWWRTYSATTRPCSPCRRRPTRPSR